MVKEIRPAAREGIFTSEFWLNLSMIVCSLVLLLMDKITVDQLEKLWPFFLGNGLYSVSRGIVKKG